MRILHVIPTYVPAYRYGGPIKSVHGLCQSLVKLGHEVHVFTTNVDGPHNLDVKLNRPVDVDGVKVWYFPSTYLRRLYWAPAMSKKLREKIRYFEIVHLHSLFLWPTWTAARCAARHGIPYLLSPRGMLVKDLIEKRGYWRKTLWINLIERHTMAAASALHATSDLEADEAKKFELRLPPIIVVPNGIEAADTNNNQLSPTIKEIIQKQNLILYLGRISWKKGLERLVKAMVHVPRGHLIIAGNDDEDYTRKLKQLIDQNNLNARVTFVGLVDGQNKNALLNAAKMLVLPSYSENFGNVVVEAMQVGCPVVITPEVGLAHIVEEAGAGIVSQGEPELLAEAINKLFNDVKLRSQMSDSGRKLVETCFSWDVVGREMQEHYRTISSFRLHSPSTFMAS